MPRGVSRYDEARLQGRLWTPLNLTSRFTEIVDARAVRWSGSNFSSLANTGTGGGTWSMTRAGSMTRGTPVNGIYPLNSNGSQGLLLSYQPTRAAGVQFVFAVAKLTASDNALFAHDWATTAGTSVVYAAQPDLFSYISGFTALQAATGNGYDLTSAQRQMVLCQKAAGTSFVHSNGVNVTLSADAAPTPPAFTGKNFYFGESGTAFGPEGIVGDVFYAAYSDHQPIAGELYKLEGWGSWTFRGDGSQLPASHPYKNRPPLIGA